MAPGSQLRLGFGGPMAAGAEQYTDLHFGGLDGPIVPMTCGWSEDRTTLTCTPNQPLHAQTGYTLHVGGGLRDAHGHLIGLGADGAMFGGQWVQGGQMPGTHGGGMGWGMMGTGWRHANGSYGMAYGFTTGQ